MGCTGRGHIHTHKISQLKNEIKDNDRVVFHAFPVVSDNSNI